MRIDQIVERFIKKIGIADPAPFVACSFSQLSADSEVNRVYMTLRCPGLLPLATYRDLFAKLDSIAAQPGGFASDMKFEYEDQERGLDKLLDDFMAAESAYELGDYRIRPQEQTIIFYFAPDQDEQAIKEQAKSFADLLKKIGSTYKTAVVEKIEEPATEPSRPVAKAPIQEPDYQGEDIWSGSEEDYTIPDDMDESDISQEELEAFQAQIAQQRQATALASQKREEQLQRESEQRRRDALAYTPAKLKDIDNLTRVQVEGRIFKAEDKLRVTKTNKHFLTIEYTDGTSSIASTVFESKKMPVSFLESLKPGTNIQVKGLVQQDKYLHQLTISPDKITILPPTPLRDDPSPEKRVELHLHTNMSSMDGISSITKYATLAKNFGMSAIGITDHGVVQAFPEAQKIGKKLGLKMLYGCELYMVDEKLEFVLNPRSVKLNTAEYVVFDLETTGLSAHYDRIIEFGATKYRQGQRVDEIDFFINPDRKLREFIVNKTHISQEDVDHGRPIKEALKDILEFFGDAVIIDHNASFDIGFLNEALKNNNLPPIKNPVIDTLMLSRYMYANKKSHTLEATARYLDISYDETQVHRAIYDAQVLEAVYQGLLDILSQDKPDLDLLDLVGMSSKDVILNARPINIVAYAKNEQGLKDLYRLISMASTDYLAEVPKIPRSEVMKYRENLLIGSGDFNGEVFDAALTKSTDELKRTMEFYDYIEVQDPACYSFLINDGQIYDQQTLLMILKDLIQAARDIGKMVVATGDAHYCDPEDKIYRDVYIFAKGIKGAIHPLNPFRRKKQKPYPNPDQHFRSTHEMLDDFAFLQDEDLIREIVITNTNRIADMLEPLKPTKDRLYPPYIKDCDTNLIKLVYDTAKKMYGDPIPEPIKNRLDTELHGIGSNGYYVIYWIASVLVRQVNATGHLVGSRGSVGSSLVATMSGITEVNPLPPHWVCPKCKHLIWADAVKCPDGFDLPDKDCPECGTKMHKDGHDIPFETFLGFHADKVPDIDLNFPSDFQAEAHEMTRQLLGAENVFKAGTIQTTEEKNAIGYVKSFFESQGIDPKTIRPAEIDRLAAGCIGVKRTTGQHPGGIIVIPSDMSVFDFTPYQYPANAEDAEWRTTQYDFHAIHDNVLKFDELGHVDPYAIKMMSDMADVDWRSIPFDDSETMSIFYSPKALKLKTNVLQQKTGALGLPEFGTSMARGILEDTQPRGYGDLVRISGLSHGTNVYAGNAQELILSGKATLRDVIGCRDDIMVGLHNNYGIPSDESFKIMEFVRKGCFTKPGFEEQGEKIIEQLKSYHVSEDYIESAKKIGYLFPKGHACAYVMMAVRVAWFKVHYPEVYYAVYYTLRCSGAYDLKIMQSGQAAALRWLQNYDNRKAQHLPIENKDKSLVNTLTIYVEMTDRGIRFGHISVQNSDVKTFTVDPQTKEIIPPFTAVDALGEVLATKIVEERNNRPFDSIQDFETRCHVPATISTKLRDLGAYEGLPESAQMTLDEFM